MKLRSGNDSRVAAASRVLGRIDDDAAADFVRPLVAAAAGADFDVAAVGSVGFAAAAFQLVVAPTSGSDFEAVPETK